MKLYHQLNKLVVVELISKEQENDGYGYPVPAKSFNLEVSVGEINDIAIKRAVSEYLGDYNVAHYWHKQEIESDLLF